MQANLLNVFDRVDFLVPFVLYFEENKQNIWEYFKNKAQNEQMFWKMLKGCIRLGTI